MSPLSIRVLATSIELIVIAPAVYPLVSAVIVAVAVSPIFNNPLLGRNVKLEMVGELASTPGRFDGSAVV